MKPTQLAEPVQGISISGHIRILKEKEEKPFDIKRTNYLRTKCSEFNRLYPERHYSVNEVKAEGRVIVSWTYKKQTA